MLYFEPKTIEEACSLLGELNGTTTVIAGGIDVVVRMNKGMSSFDNMVSLKHIDTIKGICADADGVIIGALATHTEVADSSLIQEKFPALAIASNNVGSRLIRNQGTIGGNICNASPVADTVGPLIVLNAVFKLHGPKGKRDVPAGEFFTGPGKTLKASDEILKGIFIPYTQEKTYQGFAKLGQRKNADIALVNTAVAFTVKDGIVIDAKIVFGSVAPKAIRIPNAEALMIGKKILEIDLDAVAKASEETIAPITDVRSTKEYRRRTAYYLIKDVLQELIKGI